jgi:cytochrome c553
MTVMRWLAVATLCASAAAVGRGYDAAGALAPVAPRLLSETGLYADAQTLTVDPRNRPFSPQYPLWTDGATKRRWIRLPDGATIDASNVDRWDFPVGTRIWKEFAFDGRRVETRLLWKARETQWVFASYAWNDDQRDAVLAPADGLPGVAEVAPGKRHSIPSRSECLSCHDSSRTEVLGFDALQLSDDRDPNAPHAERLTPEMITLRTLVAEERLRPSRKELVANPPRIQGDARTRAAIGYLTTNCGSCHNRESSIASLGLILKHSLNEPAACPPALATTVDRAGHWVVPTAAPGTSRLISPGRPELSALVARTKSRRPSSQMPPLGTVVADREAVDLLTRWIEAMSAGSCPSGS